MFSDIVQIIGILILGAVVMIYTKKKDGSNSKKNEKTSKDKLASEFTNVKDIRDKFLYSRDGYVFMYLKIHPISVDLFSKREQRRIKDELTSQFASFDHIIKFNALSRPVDISPLIAEYNALSMDSDDYVQKQLLRDEIIELSDFAMSGNVIEREFYQPIWIKYDNNCEEKLSILASEAQACFQSIGCETSILYEKEIYQYLLLFNNPASINYEDNSFKLSIPFIQ